ncbi:hypothetical protein SAMN02745244_01488 [Tessaracoccus bendigoensis DSM 12906]|uniref:Transposase DDE domain-containing protein n=1 Tax=Tessaracoccus bendigoensis DSM 12906 TaxID=1123357 RepID=A0A1M6FN92_9ACTN|nr:hypothetical protein SAMN02745244_01488 [Tessaracoccus bendigoensis DSM 12906]
MGAQKLPTADKDRNAAWLQLAALAVTLTAWLRHLALDGELAIAEPKTLRFRLFAVPARIARHARSRILKIPDDWAWAKDLVTARNRIWSLQPDTPRPTKGHADPAASGSGSHPGTRTRRTRPPHGSGLPWVSQPGDQTQHTPVNHRG